MDGLWILPLLGCGLMMVMMVVMMLGMGKDMFSRKEKKPSSINELRSEQKRLSEQIEALEDKAESPREREPASGAA